MNNLDVKQFAQHGVATVYEAAGRSGLIDVPLIQIVPGSRAAGPARTVLCGQGDNLMVHAVLDQVQPGEVLVLTMPVPEPVALVGELLATRRWSTRLQLSSLMQLYAIAKSCAPLDCQSGRDGYECEERAKR
jgi:regulator of RNase E activity RraA